jgi:CheY-like chemotaxis protein
MNEARPIVVIDSYRPTRLSIEAVLREAGYAVACFEPEISADVLQATRPALIILELQRANADAVMLQLDRLRNHPSTRSTPVLLTTTDAALVCELSEPLWHLGCTTLIKPFDVARLLAHVGRACDAKNIRPAIERCAWEFA